MDKEIIERVSRAILETPNATDYKTLVAINAIKAMREPTANMVKAAYDELDGADRWRICWKTMIDAVINE